MLVSISGTALFFTFRRAGAGFRVPALAPTTGRPAISALDAASVAPHLDSLPALARLVGYVPVSSCCLVRELDLQRDALGTAGVDAVNVYHDLASGVRDGRPGLDSCLRALRKGDVLVVWKLDRLGRNLAHLVNTVQDLSARGMGLRVLAGQGGAGRHHDRGRPPRVRHLRGAGRVRAGDDPGWAAFGTVAAGAEAAVRPPPAVRAHLVDRHRVRRPVVELRRLRRRVPRDLLRALQASPPFDRYSVIPVARNVWQHVQGGAPRPRRAA